jgi:hypothetical protein
MRLLPVPTGKEKEADDTAAEIARGKVKFEVYGLEMIEKEVKQSVNSGRIYLPPDW